MAANLDEEGPLIDCFGTDDEGLSSNYEYSSLEQDREYGPFQSADPIAETETSTNKSTPPPPNPAMESQDPTSTPESEHPKPSTSLTFPPPSHTPIIPSPTFSQFTETLLASHAITVVSFFYCCLRHDDPHPGFVAPWIGLDAVPIAALLLYVTFSALCSWLQKA